MTSILQRDRVAIPKGTDVTIVASLALLLLLVSPSTRANVTAPPMIDIRCDRLELNHYYDEKAKPVFDQLIGWSWCNHTCEYHVDWFVMWNRRSERPFQSIDGWDLAFVQWDRFYRVHARQFDETWTQFDPELADRLKPPKDMRVGLGGGGLPW